MKRRSLLGLFAAALCPTPPPGLPKVEKPKLRAMAGTPFQPQDYRGTFRWVNIHNEVGEIVGKARVASRHAEYLKKA